MNFGLHLVQQRIEIDELRRTWRWADTAGFDWVDVSDHFYEAPPVDGTGGYFEATTCMAALACDTKNVRIGVVVLGMGYRHPAVLAKALCTIDQLSGGRVEAGLGAGWHEPEYRAYGIPFPRLGERLDLLEEGIEVVRKLTTEARANFSGKYFRLTDAACYPKPVQERLPLWIGGVGEKRTLKIAARFADGWNGPYVGVRMFERLSATLNEWCEKDGRDPATIERNVNLSFHLALNDADLPRAEADLARAWEGNVARFADGGAIACTPKQAIELVHRYGEAGCSRVNIAVRPPLHQEALEAWAGEVIPAFANG